MKKTEYIHSLNALRVVAMVGVLLFHIFPTKVTGGFLGVITFFVLSGFLTMRNIAASGASNPFLTFWNKIVKLLPELICMIFLTAVVMALVLSEYLPDMKNQAISSVFGLNNLVQIFDGELYFEAMASLKPFTHIWAHSMELQFYFILTFTAGAFYHKRHKKYWIAAFSLLTVLSIALMNLFFSDAENVTRIYYGTDTRIFAFLIGCIGALLLERKSESEENRGKPKKKGKKEEQRLSASAPFMNLAAPFTNPASHTVLTFFLLAVSILSFFIVRNNEAVYRYLFVLFAFLQMLLIYLLSFRDTPAYRIFENRVFAALAERSFSLYLWHFPVMKIYEKLMWQSDISVATYVLTEVILIVLVTELFYRLFRKVVQQIKLSPSAPLASAAIFGTLILGICLFPYRPFGEIANEKYNMLLALKSGISGIEVEVGRDRTPWHTNFAEKDGTIIPNEGDAPTVSGSHPLSNTDGMTGRGEANDAAGSVDPAGSGDSSTPSGSGGSGSAEGSDGSGDSNPSLTNEIENMTGEATVSPTPTSGADSAASSNASDAGANSWETAPTSSDSADISGSEGLGDPNAGGTSGGENDENRIPSHFETSSSSDFSPAEMTQATETTSANTGKVVATTPVTSATEAEDPEIARMREIFDECRQKFPKIQIPFEEYLKIRNRKITLIGDSISVMTTPRLAEFFPNIQISAKTNRQTYHAYEFYEQLKNEGRIGDTVILALGANGSVDFETYDKIRADLGDKPLIVVTVILPSPVIENERNEQIYKYATTRKNIFVAKWHEHCKHMPGILYNDGVHPIETTGATAHSYVMMEAIYEALVKNAVEAETPPSETE